MRVLNNSLGLPEPDIVGKFFPQLIDISSLQKALSFLVELKARGSIFGWELNLTVGGELVLLHCAGLVQDEHVLILAGRSSVDIQHLFDEMMRMNNEQMSLLRQLIQNQAGLARSPSESGINFYEELTRVNNELVTLQRDLVRKNVELERLYAEMRKLAVTDSLTGLYNRHGFFELSLLTVEQARRHGRPFCIIMMDVDHFKKINDTYGHKIGDLVLEQVAARCRTRLRRVDIFGRYGGEEFAIVLPETSSSDAYEVAERLRRCIADEPMRTNQGPLYVTLSLGLAAPDDPEMTLEDALRFADQALYRAKESGRNRVQVYEKAGG